MSDLGKYEDWKGTVVNVGKPMTKDEFSKIVDDFMKKTIEQSGKLPQIIRSPKHV